MSNPNDPPSWPGGQPAWPAPGSGAGTAPPPTIPSAGGWEPPSAPPGSGLDAAPKQREPNAGLRTGVGLGLAVAVVVALIAAAAGVNVVDQLPHPLAWDPRVKDLVQFVEEERGMLFEKPVAVDFLTEDEFRREVTTDAAALTDEDRADIEDSTAELRALGLVDSDFDLFGETNEISGGATLAYYDPATERIAVRGTELTPYVQGTIVHEMTHALQDQHFDLEALEDGAGPDGGFRFRSVVEGDAVNVGQAYYDQLSSDDQAKYDDEEANFQSGDEGDAGGAPDYAPVVAAFFAAPYTLGPPFVGVLDGVDGDAGVNAALKVLPTSEAAIFDPSLYFDHVDPATVEDPVAPDGAEVLDGGSFGALSWFVLLSSRVDAHDALDFVDAWRGDSYVTYRQNDRVCVTARYQPTEEAFASGQSLLEEWADLMPADSATVTPSGAFLEVTSCDPGGDADVSSTNDVAHAMVVPATRLTIASQALAEGDLEFDQAWCFGVAVVDALTIDELSSSSVTPELQQTIQEAAATCR